MFDQHICMHPIVVGRRPQTSHPCKAGAKCTGFPRPGYLIPHSTNREAPYV